MDNLKISKIFLKISQGFLYLTLLTPVLISRNLFFPFVSGKIIFFKIIVELALLFYLLAFLSNPKNETFEFKKLFKNPIFISVCVFTLLFFASSFWGINAKFSLFSNYERGEGGFQMLHYLIFFFLLVSLFKTKKDWKNLFIASILVSLVVCSYALGQLGVAKCLDRAGSNQTAIQACQTGTFLSASSQVSGTLGNSSYLAVYILFTLFFIGYLILGEKRKWLKIILGIVAIFEFLILLQTQTRGVLFGLVIATIIWCLAAAIFYLFKNRSKKSLLFVLAVLGLLAVFMLILSLIAVSHPSSVASRFIKVFSPSYLLNSLKDRFWAWGSATASIMERPFGWGAENFPQAFDKYYNPKLFGIESWFDRAHNVYLDYALVGGIPLLIAFLSIFYFFYQRIFKRFKVISEGVVLQYGNENLIILSSVFILITTYLIQGFVLFDVISTYIVLFLSLAFFVNYFDKPEEERKNSTVVPWWGKGVVSILIISIFFGIYWLGFLPYQRSRILINAIQKSQAEFVDAIRTQKSDFSETFTKINSYFDPALNHKALVGGNETMIAFCQSNESFLNYILQQNTSPTKNSFISLVSYLDQESDKKEKANELIGTRPLLYIGWVDFAVGRASGETSYYQKAAGYFDKGLKESPTRMEFIYVNLEVALTQKDQNTAKLMLKKAFGLRPDLQETNKYYKGAYEAEFGTKFDANIVD
ncbi:MAG: O-antigen ligase family protein [Candidatus Paceibacterota bacterium]|jgi:O-antigen ligase